MTYYLSYWKSHFIFDTKAIACWTLSNAFIVSVYGALNKIVFICDKLSLFLPVVLMGLVNACINILFKKIVDFPAKKAGKFVLNL